MAAHTRIARRNRSRRSRGSRSASRASAKADTAKADTDAKAGTPETIKKTRTPRAKKES